MTSKRKEHTSLHRHTRIRSRLVPPLGKLSETAKVQFSSWVDDRLPDVLWLAIIRSTLGQDAALAIFREFIGHFEYTGEAPTPIPTHTFLGTLSDLEFDRYMRPIISNTEICRALGALLIFESMPDRRHWVRHAPVNANPFNVLAEAVFRCLDHQSQPSTDIR